MKDLEECEYIALETLCNSLAGIAGHSRRVAVYSMAIAQALEIHGTEFRVIAHGSLLHEIGKQTIPDSILKKGGLILLETKEISGEQIKRVCKIMRKIPSLKNVLEIVRRQKERYDGTGEPFRLRGDQIPIGARILAVAEMFDEISTARSPGWNWSFSEARQEIIKLSGTQFDPTIVEIFQRIPLDVWHQLRAYIEGGRPPQPFDCA